MIRRVLKGKAGYLAVLRRFVKGKAGYLAVLTLGLLVPLAQAQVVIPEDMEAEALANSALTAIAPGVGVLITVGIALSVAVAIVRFFLRAPKRFAR